MAKRKKTNEDLPSENQETNDASDSFGLPDIEYKPLDKVEEVVVETEKPIVVQKPQPSFKETNMSNEEQPQVVFEEEEKSNSSLVIGLVIVVVIALAGYLVYKYVYVPRQLAQQEQLEKDAAAKRLAAAEEARIAKEEEAARLAAEEAAKNVKPAIGTIETLSARTGRYYVVISSAVDDDLIMDRAKTISPKGVSTKIIPPFSKWKFFRLTIGDYDTYAIAQTNADAAKAEYGSGVWVIKY